MYSNATGFSPNARLLSGLSKKPNVSAFAKGKAMADASGLNMDRESKNQEFGLQQMNEASQQKQQLDQQAAQRAGNASRERQGNAELTNRNAVFNMGMNFDYAALQKRQDTSLKQTLLNGLARDF